MKISVKFILVFLTCLPTISMFAQEYSGGATIIPIKSDDPSITIDYRTDSVTIAFEKIVLFKNNGWFVEDKDVAITTKMIIDSKKNNESLNSITISKISKYDVKQYSGGRIEIPIRRISILKSYSLSGSDYFVPGITINLFLSKRKQTTEFSKVIQRLIEVNSKIPIPNPYSQYADIFGDTFSKILEDSIYEDADTMSFAEFGLNFLKGTSSAINYTEKTGVYAILLGSNKNEDGIIKIDQLTGKNFSYNDTGGLYCDNKQVKNNYIIIRVVSSIDPYKAAFTGNTTVMRLFPENTDISKVDDKVIKDKINNYNKNISKQLNDWK